MHGQRIGYVRVSSFDQNPERQLEQIQVDKVFTDKASGKDTRRPELERLLAFVREGDTVVVHRALLQIVGGDKLIIPFC
ncbi:TnpR recombinase [Klebsiella pneumoniae]|nr:TnpR recombinase [Klebsiella pneumoniae]